MDFAVTLDTSRVRVVEGASASVGVTINRNTFTDPVNVTVSGLPNGLTADPLVIAGDAGTLTLRAAGDAAQGDAVLTVTATSEIRTHSVPLSLLAMGLPGTLDKSFGEDGVLTALAAGRGTAVVVQADGKVVVASIVETQGSGPIGSRLARYLPSGTLDTDFLGNPISLQAIGETNALALQPDGKILLVTTVGNRNSREHGLVARFNADGSPDRGFGNDGQRQLDVNELGTRAFTRLNAVAVQPDGGILVAGGTEVMVGDKEEFHAMVARLGPTGILDSSFGMAGRQTMALGTNLGRFLALALQPDGKLVAIGQADQGFFSIAAFARFDSDGRIDNTFSTDGYLTIDLGDSSSGTQDFKTGASVVIQRDGKILVAGGASRDPETRSCLVRLNSDGVPDATFGTNGVKIVPIGSGFFDAANAVALQPDDKFVVVGQAQTPTSNAYAARFHASAQIDLGFAGGLATPPANTGDVTAHFQALALDADGRIVATGGWTVIESGIYNLVIDRFWP